MASTPSDFPLLSGMTDTTALYAAYLARDARFDGIFYIGVTSTGIYCRPICTARTPRAVHCIFFPSAAAAEKASFRPCLRCRPELAPGDAPVDGGRRIAHLIADRIEQGMLDDGAGVEKIAETFGWSARQIRRLVQQELGVSPMELVLTRRLLLAKQLLTETTLRVTDIAYASGFASIRRFNDAFRRRYGMPPSRLRKGDAASSTAAPPDTFTLRLSYRPPFDWDGLLRFFRARALHGVEWVEENAYWRTVHLGESRGWIRVTHAPVHRALSVEIPHALTPVLPTLLNRLRDLFDLRARPDVIAAHLGRDPLLAASVAQHPGLRVPGAFDGFEVAVRAILGQQISVKAATTLAGRYAAIFGERIDTPHKHVERLSPRPQLVANASTDELAALGILPMRARSILALAQEVASGRLVLEPRMDPDETIERLMALPGVGAWTAHYIAMRVVRWPDAFLKDDLIVRKRMSATRAEDADVRARAWQPWRSYAVVYLWQSDRPSGAVMAPPSLPAS